MARIGKTGSLRRRPPFLRGVTRKSLSTLALLGCLGPLAVGVMVLGVVVAAPRVVTAVMWVRVMRSKRPQGFHVPIVAPLYSRFQVSTRWAVLAASCQ